MAPTVEYQWLIDAADDWITGRPGTVVLVFLLVTAGFGLGLPAVSTESGTESFSEDVPEEQALEAVTEQFSAPFEADEGSTQLIQRGENVLSKRGLLRMLTVQERLADDPGMRVVGTESAARLVARELDPSATTLEAEIDAVERATPGQIRTAVGTLAAESPRFTALLSDDFNPTAGAASATVGIVSHEVPGGLDAGTGQGSASPLESIQVEARYIADAAGGDVVVFGSGIVAVEFGTVIGDSLLIVVPAAVALIALFLVIAYRDLVDLLLGLVGLGTTIVWTFGFMGFAGIAFSQILIAVPPLLLAVGIDFGIHTINRYREERLTEDDPERAMRTATDQLLVAFFIVTATTVIGFSSNLVSGLLPIREFGLVAAVGITFTFLVFGVYLPALKLYTDALRDRYPIPTFSQTPIGSEGSRLGGVLAVGVIVAKRVPVAFLLVALVAAGGAGYYAVGIDTTFSQEQFLPPEETADFYDVLPEPFRPGDYTITATINYLEDTFESSEDDEVVVYVEAPMERDTALEAIWRAGENPPETFVRDGRHARETSIVTIVRAYRTQDPEFDALVARNDRNANGVPDQNLDQVYDHLLASPARERTLEYLSEDRRSARVVYAVKGDRTDAAITADARIVAERYRMGATATGNIVVFEAISDIIFASALLSLGLALAGTAVFLLFVYWVLEGRASLGLANLAPIVVTVAFVGGSMRYLGFSLNAFTATVLAMTIGLGIDYSVHLTHRYIDERRLQPTVLDALSRSVYGTGGALLGSVLTTVFGIGVLVLSVFPAIGDFGLLTALSVIYAFLSSLLVLPAALVVWERVFGEMLPPESPAVTNS
ncbi:efflux RND transporter permease subunit [Haloplanus rubicundus]|uniref:RND transporter n=1 Tax=Haloplanus rubicundus TaxID=1547898 RepID=A0A345EHJ9_9EURY|nr:MMPL family transporter [Haloplanus rubicundus]AXG11671.1 RND transporter [Haloplanus rubicundus]